VVASGRGDEDSYRGRDGRRKRWSMTEYLRADRSGRALYPDYSGYGSRYAEDPDGRTHSEERPRRAQRRDPNDYYGRSTWGGGWGGGYDSTWRYQGNWGSRRVRLRFDLRAPRRHRNERRCRDRRWRVRRNRGALAHAVQRERQHDAKDAGDNRDSGQRSWIVVVIPGLSGSIEIFVHDMLPFLRGKTPARAGA